MGMLLMCQNQAVYDIDSERVLSERLLPGLMQNGRANRNTFKQWLKTRYSSNTNTIARQLKGVEFGQGNRVTINKRTHAFSLSDSYWLKDSDEHIGFEDLSPYLRPFWTGTGAYAGQAVPTLYVGGALNKFWLSRDVLVKLGKEALIEVQVSILLRTAGFSTAVIQYYKDTGIAVHNFTGIECALEQADQSGLIDPDDFDDNDVVRVYGLPGFEMILADAIIGNGDRHAGNFGNLRNPFTGAILGMAPLYDFDHALDSKSERDRLTESAVKLARGNEQYRARAIELLERIIGLTRTEVYVTRAKGMLHDINK